MTVFKSYLNKTIQSFSSGLISWTATKTQKLGRVSEAEKLKFAGNKDQFLFNSELSGTLDEARSFLAAKNIGGVKGKLADLDKSLKRRQKITKRDDKSEAGWLVVKEHQAEELAGDLEDEKRIRKAQERALKKKKQNAPKRSEKDRSASFALLGGVFLTLLLTTGGFSRCFLALSLHFSLLGKCSNTACLYIVVVCVYASAFCGRKIIFLRTSVAREKENVFSFGRSA